MCKNNNIYLEARPNRIKVVVLGPLRIIKLQTKLYRPKGYQKSGAKTKVRQQDFLNQHSTCMGTIPTTAGTRTTPIMGPIRRHQTDTITDSSI